MGWRTKRYRPSWTSWESSFGQGNGVRFFPKRKAAMNESSKPKIHIPVPNTWRSGSQTSIDWGSSKKPWGPKRMRPIKIPCSRTYSSPLSISDDLFIHPFYLSLDAHLRAIHFFLISLKPEYLKIHLMIEDNWTTLLKAYWYYGRIQYRNSTDRSPLERYPF